jgi:erythromycin esterase-like protein
MLGEASHGTHDYYVWRSHITRRLITEKGFSFIAVEGDWPDCYHVNRFIKGYTGAGNAADVLKQFNRWPTWMWANWEIASLAAWLQLHNAAQEDRRKTGFYGLDVYSLWESMEAILQYLEEVDPSAVETARKAFRCFEPYRGDEGQGYAYATRMVPGLCESAVINLLGEIQRKRPGYDSDFESAFSAEQNALTAVNAERFYRAMLQGRAESWNVRDSHMQETLERLMDLHGPEAKAIVWAHNTHIGDASATDMADAGMYNIGELARDKYGDKNVFLVGFGSSEGTVIAGRDWGAPMEVMQVPPGREGSWERLLHEAGGGNKLLLTEDLSRGPLADHKVDHRAIGVVYHPAREAYGNYVPSLVTRRYDAFLHIERTTALHPLHNHTDGHQMPDTYPFSL